MPAILSRLSILFINLFISFSYRVTLTAQNTIVQAFRSVPSCQTCMSERGIRQACILPVYTISIVMVVEPDPFREMELNCLNVSTPHRDRGGNRGASLTSGGLSREVRTSGIFHQWSYRYVGLFFISGVIATLVCLNISNSL